MEALVVERATRANEGANMASFEGLRVLPMRFNAAPGRYQDLLHVVRADVYPTASAECHEHIPEHHLGSAIAASPHRSRLPRWHHRIALS